MTETNQIKRVVGGNTSVDAFCLIDGFIVRGEDDGTANEYKRVTVPVTRLPAIFGRDHEVIGEKNFFGIGTLKQFSREHFRVDYWCNDRGRLGQPQSSDSFQWDHSQDSSELMNPDDVDLSKPFFTVTCLGKNGLCVQGQKVEKDKSIVVKHGAAVQASALCFYFLMSSSLSYQTIKVLNDHKIVDSDSVDSPPSKRRRGLTGMQADLDLLSTEELLDQLNTAIEANVWERKHQFIGSTLSGRAVIAAAKAPDLRQKAAQSGDALERSEVMEWIAESKQFSKWSQQMLTKLEAKSYQASITNAMIKAGYTRTAEKGRYIKWILPKLGEDVVNNGGEIIHNKTGKPKIAEERDSAEHDGSDDTKLDDEEKELSKVASLAENDAGRSFFESSHEEMTKNAIDLNRGQKENAEQQADGLSGERE